MRKRNNIVTIPLMNPSMLDFTLLKKNVKYLAFNKFLDTVNI